MDEPWEGNQKQKKKKRRNSTCGKKKKKGWNFFYVLCFHGGVQFARVETKIHAHLFPLLPPFAHFLQPCDTLLHIYLGNFD